MKVIEILQKDCREKVILKDNDNSDIITYTKDLTKLLKSTDVVILTTTSGNAILRPQHVISILVSEETEQIIQPQPKEELKIEENSIIEQQIEDSISD